MRLHSRTSAARLGREGSQGWDHCACHGVIALDLTAAGRSCGRGETRRRARKTSGQEDRQKGGRVGEGGTKGRGRPQQAR